jgi:DNA-binding NarL/FixJ family response regulator
MPRKIRIAVVDDHPLYRDGVVMTLARDEKFDVVGEGNSADQAIKIAEQVAPDVMLLDVGLPGCGIEAARSLSKLTPRMKIIMLTASESEEHVSAALEAGACGYVLKGISAQDLVRAVRAVGDGETYVSPGLAARLLSNLSSRNKAAQTTDDLASLTQREDQILACVANGRTNKEIARELNLSEKTVKHYMTNIMHKLQVRNRVEAALMLRKRKQA